MEPGVGDLTPTIAQGFTDCPYPLSVINAFYDANDAAQIEDSLEFFTDDAIIYMWATGAAGYKMAAKHYEGKEEIRHILGIPGMRRTIDEPDSPIYSMVAVEVADNTATFRFEPDRKRPNGKSYHAYRVTFTFDECKIASLEVIELVYWL